MLQKLGILVVALLCLSPVVAQDDDLPLVAVVHNGDGPIALGILVGLLDALVANGLIAPEQWDNRLSPGVPIQSDGELAAENIRIIVRSAGHDPLAIQGAVDRAMDMDPAALVTIRELPTLSALNTLQYMDDPPKVFFAALQDPWNAGIADASCIKPDYVTGTHTVMPFKEMLPLFTRHIEDLNRIGVIHYAGENSSAYATEHIVKAAQELGWTAQATAVTGFHDIALAIEGLISRGVQAIVLPASGFMESAMPLIASIGRDNEIPIYGLGVESSVFGATMGIGYAQWYDDGARIGHIMAAWLKGEIDIAETAIATQTLRMAMGVDIAWHEVEGMEFSEDLLKDVDVISKDTAPRPTSGWAMQEFARMLGNNADQSEQLLATAKPLLESLRCTPEMVEEQQAELEAAA